MAANENYPVNTETRLYICGTSNWTLAEIMEAVNDHFGVDVSIHDVTVTAEYIHTRCIGYDLYDSSDYDTYIVVELK